MSPHGLHDALTKSGRALLEHALWAETAMNWCVCGSREHRRSTIRRLETRGMLGSVGPVVICDGDGFALEPERFRHGWKLTDAGRALAKGLSK